MLRYLVQTPPSLHLLLLGLILVLRLPILWGDLTIDSEAQYLLTAIQAWEGGTLYEDAWFAGPPVTIWIYEGFYALFGRGAIWGLRVFTILWIYLIAVYFNGMLSKAKITKRFEGLPAALAVGLMCLPGYEQELSAELLALLPILWAFDGLLQSTEGRGAAIERLYRSGLSMGLALLISYKVLFLLGALLLAYLILRTFRVDEFSSMIGGVIVAVILTLGILYARGNLQEFYETGFLYYWQRIGLAGTKFYGLQSFQTLMRISFSWGAILLLTGIGFFHYRARFFSYVARIRSLETVMANWLIFGLIMLISKYRRIDYADLMLLVPPIAFYAARPLSLKWPRILRWAWLITAVAGVIFSYSRVWLPSLPIDASAQGNQSMPWEPQNSPPPHSLVQLAGEGPFWIMDHQPKWYQDLDTYCPYPFVDYRMAYHRFTSLPGHHTEDKVSAFHDREVFSAFGENPPQVVIDPHGDFPKLVQRFPTLFGGYKLSQGHKIHVYLHPSKLTSNP